MALQALPFLSHRCHWYENVIGVSPTHVPVVVCRLTPTSANPETTGGLVLTGWPFAVPTTPVSFESAVAAPSLFLAVTRKRIVEPRSALTTLYSFVVAPA